MVLEEYRKHAEPYLTPIAKYMIKADPSTLSVLAFIFAIFAGISFICCWIANEFLILASVLVFLNGLFDALDGKVARLSRKASLRGDFLDHVLDRYADVFIIGGIMLSPYSTAVVGLLAIVGIIFASYMGTQAQAVGLSRKYTGMLGRADRLVLLIITPLIQYLLVVNYPGYFKLDLTISDMTHGFTVTELVLLYFAIAGHITAVQRAYLTWVELKKQEGMGKCQ